MAGRKANFAWQAGPPVASQGFGTTAASAVSFITLINIGIAQTLRRLIVDAYFQNPSMADNTAMGGRAGIIVVAPQVVAVGATAMPRPTSDAERPWLWNRGFASKQQLVGTNVFKYILLHLHDDVRGMRKVKQDDVLVFVLETNAGSSVDTWCGVRALFST